MTTIALFGAAGKMGARISRRLRENTDYQTLYVEAGEAGVRRLQERGDIPTSPEAAAGEADVLILAIPDKLIGKASKEIVPHMKPGAMLILLDPAAPHGGELPERKISRILSAIPATRPSSTMRPTPRRAWISSAQSRPNSMWWPH